MVQVLSTLRSTAVVALLVIGSAQAYSPAAKNNVAVYWGQSTGVGLAELCESPGVDIVLLSFMHKFPQSQSDLPGTDFSGLCNDGHYPGTSLLKPCAPMPEDIKTCQNAGKKVILALGGAIANQLTGVANGKHFADQVWEMFGPQSANKGLPRPIDDSEVDGFDFDIEAPSPDNEGGWIAMINRLREHYATQDKEWLITGAPQCVIPDANMGQMMTKAQFDIILMQLYNTQECSAKRYIEEGEGLPFEKFLVTLAGTPSENAKIYLGLEASEDAGNQAHYLTDTQVEKLVEGTKWMPNFGGIMMWEASRAHANTRHGGKPYYQVCKDILNKLVGGFAPEQPVHMALKATFPSDITVATSITQTFTLSSPCPTTTVTPVESTTAAPAFSLAAFNVDFLKTFLPMAVATVSASTEISPSATKSLYPVATSWSATENPTLPFVFNTTLSVSQNVTLRTSTQSATFATEAPKEGNMSAASKKGPVAVVFALGAIALGFVFFA